MLITLGGKVLVPTREAVDKLVAARLAADVMGVPTVIIARTDAQAANLLTSDVDDNDKKFCTGEKTHEGFYRTIPGLNQCISRGLAYAQYGMYSVHQLTMKNLFLQRIFNHFS